MTSYSSLKQWLAGGLTLAVIGVALFVVSRNGAEPSVAQGKKVPPQDWAMYGGAPARNMVNLDAKGLAVTWVDKKDELDPKKIKWSAGLGSKAYGGPIVAGGRVFVGTNNQNLRDKTLVKPKVDEKGNLVLVNGKQVMVPSDLGVVMCFDEATGAFNWQAVHTKLPGGQVVDWPLEGVCSSPHVDGDRMYYTTNSCKVVCADVATGKPHWEVDMIAQLGVFPHNITDCSPLLLGDQLYVITANGVNENHINVPAPKAPSFIRIEVSKNKGTVVWQDRSPSEALLDPVLGKLGFKTLLERGRLIQHGQWANPSYAVVNGQPQVIFPGGDGWIYAFDPNAKNGDAPLWKFDCNPKDAKYILRTGERSDFIATPVIYKNRVYIGTGQDPEHRTGIGHLWCIDMTKKGDVSPELVTDDTVFPPKTKPNPNSAAVWHYGGVITDPATQKKLKRNYYFGRTMSTCAIHEDLVYASDLNGVLHCLDASTGKLQWEYSTDADIWSSPYYADGKVYLGNDDGVVYVFKHGNKLEKLAENLMGARVRATPVAANGVLYVMTENKLYAIKN